MLKPTLRNPSFFGRKDILDQIDKALIFPKHDSKEKYSRPQLTFAICGLGGVGKTEIAREYAFSRQDSFDAVFWIDAEQPIQLSEGFATIATQLGFSDSSDKDRVVSRDTALEWLSNPLKRPSSRGLNAEMINSVEKDEANWLLVFNNADDLALLQTFWPSGQRGSILITSRDPMAKRGRPGVDLRPFELEEASTLLRQLTNTTETPENEKASISLSERLGGLPLAITQVAALIDRWEMTLLEFLRYLDKQTSIGTVAKSKPPMLQDHYNHSLFTVWALESLSPSALAVLRVLSFLNPDSIREFLLLQTIPSNILPHYPTSEELFIIARLDLTKTSLVRRDRAESQMTIHRLVQDVVRAQMSPDSIMRTINFTTELVLQAWPTSFLRFDHNTATWNQSEELLPHILKLKDFFEENAPMMRSHSNKENFAKLLLFAGGAERLLCR
ncbi:P-loop containing nucleoside triphosphate hydrolase protein [Xylaria flabelliformis]|nr:P-loop containing nucleoside triphosphate hydrolase protein [Xylaria flabelliformis]